MKALSTKSKVCTHLAMACVLLLCLMTDVSSAEEFRSAPPISGYYLIKLIGALIIVLALFLLLSRWLRQFSYRSATGTDSLAVLDSLAVSSRDKIMIVRAGEEQLLLGLGPSGVVRLHHFDKPVIEDDGTAKPTFQSQFAGLLAARGVTGKSE